MGGGNDPGCRQEILLITYPDKEEEAITRLSRVGYDHAIGFLDGGIDSGKKLRRNVKW